MKWLVLIILCLTMMIENKSVPFVSNPIVENCVACKFIWENVEEALGVNGNSSDGFLNKQNNRNPILAAQSFQYFCRISPDIFYEPCNVMFEKLFFMTQDFCAGKKTIELCVNNGMCSNQ